MRSSSGGDRQWLNLTLVGLAAASSIGFLLNPKKNTKYLALGGLFWAFQFVESLTSNTWFYLNNIRSKSETIEKLEEFKRQNPVVNIRIENFHYETREKKPDDSFERDFKEKSKKIDEDMARLDREIEEMKK